VEDRPIERPRTPKRFTPPILLIREQMNLPHGLWSKYYLTYKSEIVGFAAPKSDLGKLAEIDRWLTDEASALHAYVAAISVRLFTRKATVLSSADVMALPYPETKSLDISANEKLVVDDVVQYQRDLIRLGADAEAMRFCQRPTIDDFARVFCQQINAIYKKVPLQPLEAQLWPGIVCLPFVFGKGSVDWNGPVDFKDKLSKLLHEQRHESLWVTRVARIYDDRFIFLLKPNQTRYWLKSVALRDADEATSELRSQGF
jgi:hypothetical protein